MNKKLDFYCDEVLSGRFPIKKVVETENCLAFNHTKPGWSVHIVIIPKTHIESLTDLQNLDLVKELFQIVTDIVKTKELFKTNYKIITNGGSFQESKHLHFHLVSGEPLGKANIMV
ncbi:MAG: HIT domain-containing protein [Candidatus Kerfeldbacteria bacterium]|nr:HIT domain-containing protein [Candidatus Kerfeldbacteria bacterium]